MITAVQRDILRLLEEVCHLSEDIRFGQLVDFLGFMGQDATNRNLAVIEDEQFLEILERHKADLQALHERRKSRAGVDSLESKIA